MIDLKWVKNYNNFHVNRLFCIKNKIKFIQIYYFLNQKKLFNKNLYNIFCNKIQNKFYKIN